MRPCTLSPLSSTRIHSFLFVISAPCNHSKDKRYRAAHKENIEEEKSGVPQAMRRVEVSSADLAERDDRLWKSFRLSKSRNTSLLHDLIFGHVR